MTHKWQLYVGVVKFLNDDWSKLSLYLKLQCFILNFVWLMSAFLIAFLIFVLCWFQLLRRKNLQNKCIRLLYQKPLLFCNHEDIKRWSMLLPFEKVHKVTADFGVHLCENIRTRSRLWLRPKCQEMADSSISYSCVALFPLFPTWKWFYLI